jgi:hypothetical protein
MAAITHEKQQPSNRMSFLVALTGQTLQMTLLRRYRIIEVILYLSMGEQPHKALAPRLETFSEIVSNSMY